MSRIAGQPPEAGREREAWNRLSVNPQEGPNPADTSTSDFWSPGP